MDIDLRVRLRAAGDDRDWTGIRLGLVYDLAMPKTHIRLGTLPDLDELLRLRPLLWPETTAAENREELSAVLSGAPSGNLPSAIVVAEDSEGSLAGFLEAGLRSHADGCDTRVPVGYVEGWFVVESHRRTGIGAQLLRFAEQWARGHGCVEMASDALIDNQISQQAHEALGFEVVDRCVHYRKTLS